MYILQCKLAGEQTPDELPDSLLPIKSTTEVPEVIEEEHKHDLSTIKLGKLIDSRPSFKVVIQYQISQCSQFKCVLGEQSGKTSLIMRFLKGEFHPSEEPTVGKNRNFTGISNKNRKQFRGKLQFRRQKLSPSYSRHFL
jgi:hypothetical protein